MCHHGSAQHQASARRAHGKEWASEEGGGRKHRQGNGGVIL